METIAQFGTGAFLRGFIGDFVDEANRAGRDIGSIVAIASTESPRAAAFAAQGGRYTLMEQGVSDGAAFRRRRAITATSRALSAGTDWPAVLELARAPALRLVVSNSSEIGIATDPADGFDGQPPRSFPAKLTRFLYERAVACSFDERRGVVVLPCELIDRNGDRLRALVVELAVRWDLDARFLRWLEASCRFCNTLVDRIVTGRPAPADLAQLTADIGYEDRLATVCEPYRLFAIEGDATLRDRLGFGDSCRGLVVASDITPFHTRKVRILNGAHSVMAPVGLLAGIRTVREALEDKGVGGLARTAIFDEIVYGLEVEGGEAFARDVLTRFMNPFIRHELADITLQATAKIRARIVPSVRAYAARTGRAPSSLALGFAAHLLLVCEHGPGDRHPVSHAADAAAGRIRAAWELADRSSEAGLHAFAHSICADAELWGEDLARLGGFGDTVGEHLALVRRDGIRAALDARPVASPALAR
ncbi:MAG TPA: tagaturonate reductase [Gemmatimonadaceae bacterium]|nr:tagaturonate reductase [Gemmatimonadaceae bacterium]